MTDYSRREAIARAAGIAGVAVMAGSFGAGAAFAAPPRPKPLVFGHRGCSALRPEHTLGSYAKAIQDGADFIEPDLVITKDGVLVARHENNIIETTDVAKHPEFAARRTTKTIDGQQQTGWFVEDFTLAELKTLRAVERLGVLRPESKSYDGQFQVLTFEEVVDFTAAESAARGRTVGLVPELKHSTYFAGIGMPLEDRFLGILAGHEYTRRAPVEVQSFEIANLRYLRRKLGRPANIKLMQLVGDDKQVAADVVATGGKLTFGEMVTPKGLREIAGYADIVAPQVRGVIPRLLTGGLALRDRSWPTLMPRGCLFVCGRFDRRIISSRPNLRMVPAMARAMLRARQRRSPAIWTRASTVFSPMTRRLAVLPSTNGIVDRRQRAGGFMGRL